MKQDKSAITSDENESIAVSYTVIRFQNFVADSGYKHAILIQPKPRFPTRLVIEAGLCCRHQLLVSDCPPEDSYVIFWLYERATAEQIDLVRNILDYSVNQVLEGLRIDQAVNQALEASKDENSGS